LRNGCAIDEITKRLNGNDVTLTNSDVAHFIVFDITTVRN
jgi:hypothetical protein